MKHLRLFFLIVALLFPSGAYAQQGGKTFLPLVSGAGAPPLPFCTAAQLEALSKVKTAAAPDYNAPSLCQIDPSTVQSYPIDDVRPIGSDVQASGTDDVFMPRKWAINQFYCPGCATTNGLTGIRAMITGQPVTLDAGQPWSNNWYGNYISAGDDTVVPCDNGNPDQFARFIAGVGMGRPSQQSSGSTIPYVYWEIMRSNNCHGYFVTSMSVDINMAPLFEIFKNANGTGVSYWTGRVYYGGAWVNLFTNQVMPFADSGHLFNAGQEIGNTIGNFTYIHSKVNTTLNVAVRPYGTTYRTWYETLLPTSMQGKSATVTGSPMNSHGIGIPDFGSRASTVNP